MIVRGAPAIGATGCFGIAQAINNYDGDKHFKEYLIEIIEKIEEKEKTKSTIVRERNQ